MGRRVVGRCDSVHMSESSTWKQLAKIRGGMCVFVLLCFLLIVIVEGTEGEGGAAAGGAVGVAQAALGRKRKLDVAEGLICVTNTLCLATFCVDTCPTRQSRWWSTCLVVLMAAASLVRRFVRIVCSCRFSILLRLPLVLSLYPDGAVPLGVVSRDAAQHVRWTWPSNCWEGHFSAQKRFILPAGVFVVRPVTFTCRTWTRVCAHRGQRALAQGEEGARVVGSHVARARPGAIQLSKQDDTPNGTHTPKQTLLTTPQGSAVSFSSPLAASSQPT